MKKLTVLLLVMLGMFFVSENFQTRAYPSSIENVVEKFEWTLKYKNGTYFIESNIIQVEHDHMNMVLRVADLDYIGKDIIQPGYLSNVSFYLDYNQTNSSFLKYFDYEAGSYSDYMYLSDKDTYHTPTYEIFDLGVYKGLYMKVRLQLTSVLTNNERQQLVYLLNSDDVNYMFDWSFEVYNVVEETISLLDLPETTGSPFVNANLMLPNETYYGTVEFSYINNDVTLIIKYFGEYVYVLENVVFSDASFLDDVENVYYYTENGDRYLYFSYGEADDFVLTDGNAVAKPWKGFTIWNLTTHEVHVTQRAWVLTYIDVVDLNAYAYFYMPTIPHDDLLSVSLTFNYRVGRKGITTFWSQKYSDWETKAIILERGAESLTSLPQWVYDTYVYSASAMAAGLAISLIPTVGPAVGIPLLVAGSIGAVTGAVGAVVELMTFDINQIEKINYPSSILKSTIESHYSELVGSPVTVGSTPLYKLHMGSFTGTDVNYVEFDQSNFKYTEIVWTTNGQVYVLSEDYIDEQVIVDRDYVATRPEETPPLNLMNMLMLPLITLFFMILAFRMKAFSDIKQLIIVVGLYALTLLMLGVI